MTILLSIDPGSRWLARVAFDTDARAVLFARTFDVNPVSLKSGALRTIDVRGIAAAILIEAAEIGAERILMEHAEWFPRAGSNPGEQINSQRQWTLCDRIVRCVVEMAADRVPPIPVEVITVNAVRGRVLPRRSRDEPKMTADSRVAAALPAYLSPESLALVNEQPDGCPTASHQRDAAALAVGWPYVVPVKAPRSPKAPGGPRPKRSASAQRNAGWLARRSAARAAARLARGCNCGTLGPRCKRSCNAYVERTYRKQPHPDAPASRP